MRAKILAWTTIAEATSLVWAGRALAATCDTSGDPLVNGANCAAPSGKAGSATLFGAGGVFQKVANFLILLVGAIAVIMLIIGGLRYVISSGNEKAVEGAKNTILYAIIGIVVAILAYAAVKFVIAQVG